MKIKSIAKFSFSTFIPGYFIFWGVIFAILTFFMMLSFTGNSVGTIGGLDSASVIFMLIVGITGYRESLSMSVQNGVSRKTYFLGTALFFVIFAVIGSIGDLLLNLIGNFYESQRENLLFESTYEQIFLSGLKDDGALTPVSADYLKAFVMRTAMNTAALSGGLLIGSAFYRMNKIMRIVVPVAFYLFGFIGLPILVAVCFDQIAILMNCFNWIGKSCWNLSLTMAVCAFVFLGVSYLFIRRVQINDRK